MMPKELLTHSNLPIAKIAQSVGFSSQSYFSQVFRKEVHTTPGAYRKTNGTEKSGFEKPLFSVPIGSFKTKYLY